MVNNRQARTVEGVSWVVDKDDGQMVVGGLGVVWEEEKGPLIVVVGSHV